MDLPDRITDFVGGSTVPVTIAYAGETDLPLRVVNDAFCAMTGYRRDQLLGRNCRFLQGDVDQPEARAEIRRALAEGAETQVLLENFRADGTRFTNLLFLYPILDAGEVRIFLGSQFELTGSDLVERSITHSDHLYDQINRAIQDFATLRMARRRYTANALAEAIRGWLSLR